MPFFLFCLIAEAQVSRSFCAVLSYDVLSLVGAVVIFNRISVMYSGFSIKGIMFVLYKTRKKGLHNVPSKEKLNERLSILYRIL